MTDEGYRLAIFDFDGTLADSFPWFLGAVNRAADRYGFRRIEDGEVDALRGMSARRIIAHLRVPGWKLPLVARYMRWLAAEEIDRIRPFEGMIPLLHALADRGVELAVVSSNSRENVQRVLGADAAARVAFWECGASVFGKGRLFRRVLARSGTDSARALCIGDEVRDAEAARAAGIPFGAVTWGYTSAATLRTLHPAHVFESVGDIAGVFGGVGGGPRPGS